MVSWLLFINTWVEAQRPYRKQGLCSNTHASGWSFQSIRHTNCTTNWLQNIFALVTSMTPNLKHHTRTQCNCHSNSWTASSLQHRRAEVHNTQQNGSVKAYLTLHKVKARHTSNQLIDFTATL